MKEVVSILFMCLFLASVSLADLGDNPKLGQNYPNPAKEKTYVEVEFSSPRAQLVLSNILGETIQVLNLQHSGTYVIDVTEIPEGLYFYTLEADGHKSTKKLTVKK